MPREYFSSKDVPGKPHNSPAVKVGNLVFCSGQTAAGPIEEATVGALTWEEKRADTQLTALTNLKTVLDFAGSGIDKIVKANVYLANMDDYAAMNSVYVQFLPTPVPARTCISPAKLPNGAVVEIECIAEVE